MYKDTKTANSSILLLFSTHVRRCVFVFFQVHVYNLFHFVTPLDMNWFTLTSCALFFVSVDSSEFIEKTQKDCCKDFATAANCLAVDFCLYAKWQPDTIRENIDAACMVCLNETRLFRANKYENPTSQDVENYLTTINNLVSSNTKKSCNTETYDESYTHQLSILLASDLRNADICSLLNYCTNKMTRSSVSTVSTATSTDEKFLSLPTTIDAENEVDECEKGPFHSCLNISNAQTCHVTDHCIETVWRLNDYANDDNAVCQVCKEIIKEVRDESRRKNPREVREILTVSCLIPFSEIRRDCEGLHDKYDVNLEKIIQSELSPLTICSVSGFCNSPRVNELIASQPTKLEEYLINRCTNCTTAFTLFGRYLQKNSKTDLIQYFVRICDKFTNLDSCSSVVNFYFEKIYPPLLEMKPWEACHFTSMCTYQYHLHRSITLSNLQNKINDIIIRNDQNVICDLCKQVVSELKMVLIADTNKDQFREYAQIFCEQTQQSKESCSSSLDQHIDRFYDFLKAADSNELCEKFVTCSSTKR